MLYKMHQYDIFFYVNLTIVFLLCYVMHVLLIDGFTEHSFVAVTVAI